MRIHRDKDIKGNSYNYIPYEYTAASYKPRYALSNTINHLGDEGFLFRKTNQAFFVFTKFEREETSFFPQIYFKTYNDAIRLKTGKEETYFIPYNDITKNHLKEEKDRLFKISPFKCEIDYFNNIREYLPLCDAKDSLLKNKESFQTKDIIKGIKPYHGQYVFDGEHPQNNLSHLIEINLRCCANLQPYNPLDYMSKDTLNQIIDYSRLHPDKLFETWKNNCKKLDAEHVEYKLQKNQASNNQNIIQKIINKIKGSAKK